MNATFDIKAPYNTAIFYDVENLTKGYGFSKKIVQGLSLHFIVKKIGETGKTGRIAMHRAYANWLNPHLSFMHTELMDLDIEPVTVSGSHGGVIKNIADIRLAIDVIDTLHTHPEISTYVIISGDGAYASLARKLHEYSKVVIGCAYTHSTNKMFADACDHFIWIEDPEIDHDTVNVRVSDTRTQHLIEKINNTDSNSNNLIWSQINELLSTFVGSKEYAKALEIGLNPSVIREYITAAIPNFSPSTLGYNRFIDFLAEAVEHTPMNIYLIPPSAIKIGLKSHKPQNGVALSTGNIKRFGQDDTVEIRDLRIRRMCREVNPISANVGTNELVNKLKEIIDWIKADNEFRSSLKEGINPSTIDCAFRQIVSGFRCGQLGFNRLTDLLCWLTWGTDLCISQNRSNKSNWKVVLRSDIPAGFDIYESSIVPPSDSQENKKEETEAKEERPTPEPIHTHKKEEVNIFRQFSDLFKLKH